MPRAATTVCAEASTAAASGPGPARTAARGSGCASHRITVSSSLADARSGPVGLNATLRTGPVWPSSGTGNGRRVRASSNMTGPCAVPAASRLPSALYATESASPTFASTRGGADGLRRSHSAGGSFVRAPARVFPFALKASDSIVERDVTSTCALVRTFQTRAVSANAAASCRPSVLNATAVAGRSVGPVNCRPSGRCASTSQTSAPLSVATARSDPSGLNSRSVTVLPASNSPRACRVRGSHSCTVPSRELPDASSVPGPNATASPD